MPFPHNELFVLFRKILSFSQIVHSYPIRLPQFDQWFYGENGFTIGVPHMDVNRFVVIAVEEEYESIFFEYPRHPVERSRVS